ncbi:MAG: undecaprenyl-diphosphate phosphatase [Myxococcales bacterium]|nr:undecaprenyl-diphosphate phosphatase [Myxococcales bacterium]MCB9539822.1 undecaprenyl-diphosphate phosphatase [Myxococcales bacterium]
MDLLSAALLGLVQALTEFLPVSSSGHLVLAEALLGADMGTGAAFEVAVHFGTLLSVAVLFRRDLRDLLAAAFDGLRGGGLSARLREDARLRLLLAIVIGCVPAGVVGVAFKDQLEALFDAPRLVCAALIATGVYLLASHFAQRGDGEVTPGRALAIGVAQAVAIIPGVSRAGSTIATAMFLGVERDLAARYSFLMSLPVIFGATLLKARDLLDAPPSADALVALGVGALVSFVAGLGALALLMRLVRRGVFGHFGWYCLTVGVVGLALL